MDDIPVTGDPIIDTATRVFDWLGRQVEKAFGPIPPPSTPSPADMSDVQLHHAVHDIGATLLNKHGPMLQATFARYGPTMGDRRFPAALPTTVRAHILLMVTQANDSYGLALLGLRHHATASALGPIRNVAETYAYARWLLESPDEKVRLGRAYRLTVDAIDQLQDLRATLNRIAPRSEHTVEFGPRLGAGADRMRKRLTDIALEDGVPIAAKPKRSLLVEKYLPQSGGYMFYSLLSNAGVHPGAGRAHAFYGRPGTGIADFDFKGLHNVRSYWMSVNIRLYLDLCDLAAPVLGWQDWDALAEQTRTQLGPLAGEAGERYLGPVLQAMANTPTWDNPPSPDSQSAGTDDTTTGGTPT